jgi:four helix bundle protein
MVFKFEKLEVWGRSVALTDRLFILADELPRHLQHSFGEQLRRASLSISTNIAEGTGRDAAGERRQFYRYAKGSVYEVVSLLAMLGKRGLLTDEGYRDYYREADQIASILTVLSRRG